MTKRRLYYLNGSDPETPTPEGRIHGATPAELLPAVPLTPAHDDDALPLLSIDGDDGLSDTLEGMDIHLTADEPEIPDGTVLDQMNAPLEDDFTIPDENLDKNLEEDRPMPRLR